MSTYFNIYDLQFCYVLLINAEPCPNLLTPPGPRQGLLLAVVRLRRVARSWANALVLHLQHVLQGDVLLRPRVVPLGLGVWKHHWPIPLEHHWADAKERIAPQALSWAKDWFCQSPPAFPAEYQGILQVTYPDTNHEHIKRFKRLNHP